MKAYLWTTCSLFALLTVVHLWRVWLERHLASDPFFIAITLVAAGMSLWAFQLLRRTNSA